MQPYSSSSEDVEKFMRAQFQSAKQIQDANPKLQYFVPHGTVTLDTGIP
jgi:hypothetical protein